MDPSDNIPENSMIGRRIGVYRLDEEVGRGGMGVVYRAERADGEFDQTVAVKLIKRGMDTDLILKRFRRERQITAALNHPNIAYFLGGGSTEDGLPYFVMEFIVGKALYTYCDEKRLDVKDRLRVFRQVCWAVEAAHELKVIHRDLKPSNIMVNEDGKPKLLDFGIAKVLDPDLMGTDGEPTATQLRVMTPEYASPEQIGGDRVDAPSDIYSLGVILYELLTGHRPYKFKRKVSDEVARIIREELPTSPSGSLTQDESLLPIYRDQPTSLEIVLRLRNSSLEALRRELSGDLDRIVLKALRKDPAERYQSAGELADDISNFIEGRPVIAEIFTTLRGTLIPKSSDKTSLAILPFKLLGGPHTSDTGDDFLGIGLADALISRLSGVQRIVVRPTSSVLPFGDSSPYDAGTKLGVDYVLDGNVRRSGDRIRVSVQLLKVEDNDTKWARAFDEDLKDVLELEDLLAEQVASSVLPEISGEERKRLERRGTNKTKAYGAYMRGRYFWSKFTDSYLLKAVAEFNQAIDIDPDYALPYIGLADFYIWSAIFGEIPTKEGFSKAQAALRRALEIDDALGEAYAVLAFAVLCGDWNWSECEFLIGEGLRLNPNFGFAHECYSNFLLAQGRIDEAIVEIKRAEELDPVSPRAILMTSYTLYQSRHFDEAVDKARKGNGMQDDFPQGLIHLGNALTARGDNDEAVTVLRKAAEIWGKSGLPRYILCFARAAQGKNDAVRTIIDKLLATAETGHMKPYFIAMAYVAAGDLDTAFTWFEKAVEEQNEWMLWFGIEPKLDPIRSDPRYLSLLERTNNPIAKRGVYEESRPITAERERSIAVLPFRLIGVHDTGGRSDEEYLSLGLADAVTMRLSNIRRFLVRPTSSVLPFTGHAVDPFAAGRALGVEFIVDGIIRHVGDRIRVTAQLLNVEESSTRWSASFSERHTDVLDLEDSISEQVTQQLVPHLTGEERDKLARRGTDKPEAHDAYLQGRYFWNQFTPGSFPKSIAAFRKAVEIDPNYALAHVGIADYYTWACIYGILSPSEGFPKVLESASKALAIDDSLAEAHAALGLYHSNMQDWAKAEVSYRRAVELNPNYPLGHEWLSAVLVGTGRFEEGIKEILIAEQLDPLSVRPKVLSAWHLYQTRSYELALEKASEIHKLSPEFVQAHLQMGNILVEMGEHEKALGFSRRAVELAPDSPLPIYNLCFSLAANGLTDEANQVVATLAEQAKETYIPPYFIGMSHLAVGNIDKAFELLEAARDENSAWVLWYGSEPKLDKLRDDPRYIELLRSTDNPMTAMFAK